MVLFIKNCAIRFDVNILKLITMLFVVLHKSFNRFYAIVFNSTQNKALAKSCNCLSYSDCCLIRRLANFSGFQASLLTFTVLE